MERPPAFAGAGGAPPLRSSWAVRAEAGEPVASVQVRNLQAVVRGPLDAWARPGRPQPALVSAELGFAEPFRTAAAADNVTSGDTVHYGTLSKALLDILARRAGAGAGGDDVPAGSGAGGGSLPALVAGAWRDLTGQAGPGAAPPVVDTDRLRFMALTVRLPKATLLGEGASFTASACFARGGDGRGRVASYGSALRLHGLRVPTLIGVNANERLARQFVVTDVELDRLDNLPAGLAAGDLYTRLEGVVTKELESSSFETLEALGTRLCDQIASDLVGSGWPSAGEWHVKVTMEKPTAVPMADCPVVQVRKTYH